MDKNKKYKKQMIAPIVATIGIIIYYILYCLLLITFVPKFWAILLCILAFIFSILMIKVCIERIKEIKGGETDDLSKY